MIGGAFIAALAGCLTGVVFLPFAALLAVNPRLAFRWGAAMPWIILCGGIAGSVAIALRSLIRR